MAQSQEEAASQLNATERQGTVTLALDSPEGGHCGCDRPGVIVWGDGCLAAVEAETWRDRGGTSHSWRPSSTSE